MARGYIVFDGANDIQVVKASQGYVSDLSKELGNDYGWGRAIASQLTGLKLLGRKARGIYRARFSHESLGGGRLLCSIELGKRLKDKDKEAARLRDKADKQKRSANTRSPGIRGFAQAEAAATARLQYNRRESIGLAVWLEKLEWSVVPRRDRSVDTIVRGAQSKLNQAKALISKLSTEAWPIRDGEFEDLVDKTMDSIGELESFLESVNTKSKEVK